MKELDFQKALVDAARKEGGYGLKMSNRHLAGIPDLLIKLPQYDTALIECKRVERKTFHDTGSVSISTTKLQQITLSRFQKAMGLAAVVILIDIKWPQRVIVTTDVRADRLFFEETNVIERGQGEPWPIRGILKIMGSTSPWTGREGGV